MKKFKVQIARPASLIAWTEINATSPLKAKAIAEYKASDESRNPRHRGNKIAPLSGRRSAGVDAKSPTSRPW